MAPLVPHPLAARLALALPVAGALLASAGAAAAHAATVAVPPCAVALPGQRTVPVSGTGFAPGTFVRLQADGQTIGGLQVDPAGNFADTLLAPTLASPSRTQQTFELAAVDDAGNRAVVPLRITRVTADLPERARPGSRVRYRVTGFPVDRVVFLHVRRGGRTLGSFRIGRTAAPCGVAQRRLKYMPLKRWRTGSYDYWFQQSRRFSADAPSVRIRIAIVRRVRPA